MRTRFTAWLDSSAPLWILAALLAASMLSVAVEHVHAQGVSSRVLTLAGPAAIEVGDRVEVTVRGLPEPDLTVPLGESFAWLADIHVILDSPEGGECEIESEIGMTIAPFAWKLDLSFTPKVGGIYVVVFAYYGPTPETRTIQTYRVRVGPSVPVVLPDEPVDPTDPPLPSKSSAVTYVYEKDRNSVPRPVSAALQELNAGGSGIVATEFERDTVNGFWEVPEQYRVALKVAKDVGLPCLVYIRDGVVVRYMKDPQTENDVAKVVK